MLKFSTSQVYRCINFLLKTVEDDDFSDDDAQVMEGEEITRESHTFDVSLMRTMTCEFVNQHFY